MQPSAARRHVLPPNMLCRYHCLQVPCLAIKACDAPGAWLAGAWEALATLAAEAGGTEAVWEAAQGFVAAIVEHQGEELESRAAAVAGGLEVMAMAAAGKVAVGKVAGAGVAPETALVGMGEDGMEAG